MIGGPFHKRLRDFEAFDEIRFRVVPRFKTSGLSGDEWRQHVEVEFVFKGSIVHATGFRDMQTALMMAPAEWVRAQEPIPDGVIEAERAGICDQPSCTSPSAGRFLLKRETAADGRYLDPANLHFRSYRQFCKRHVRRGDCSREDSDDNYEPMGDVTAAESTNIEESPASTLVLDVEAFLGKEGSK